MDIETFRNILRKIRWNDFVKFIDSNECMRGDYACWSGARYIDYLAGNTDLIKTDLAEEQYPNDLYEHSMMEQWEGIYLVSQSTKYEEHFFSIDIDGDNLTVYQTYGGVECFQKIDFDTNLWIESYQKIFEGDLDAYNFCFNLNVNLGKMKSVYSNIIPDSVRFKKLY